MRTKTAGRLQRWANSSRRRAASVAAVCLLASLGAGAWPAGAQTSVATAGQARVGGLALGSGPGSRPISALEGTDGLFGDGGVLAYGAARFLGSPTSVDVAAPVVAMAATPDGNGYWLVGADGGVYHYGDAAYYGSTGGLDLYAPIIEIAATPDGRGYWLVGADGGVFTFGDAGYFGSTGKLRLRRPIVGFASTADGKGYWLVTDYGGVYAFGDAHYYGSLGATNLHSNPVVAIAATADGKGYWLAQGGGEVHPYGDAPRLGEMRGHPPVDGMARTPDGHGYWLVCDNGEVDPFGDASRLGGNSGAVPTPPISGIVADGAAEGYWLLDSEAFRVSLKHPGAGRGARIVKFAASQVGPSPDGGDYCNPYGPCEEWCALFATWVWQKGGIPIPRYAFVGDVYYWAARYTRVVPVSARPAPGDLVLYGTGPQGAAESPHMGVVAQVWPDGEIDTVEGDAGPGEAGWTAVLVNGPYPPSESYIFNGMPIYAFAVP